MSHVKTFQYSVKENIRPIDHAKGSHGIPGLYFKYDVSALKVIVKQDQEGFMTFLIRISSVIAGIIVISGESVKMCAIRCKDELTKANVFGPIFRLFEFIYSINMRLFHQETISRNVSTIAQPSIKYAY